MTDQTSAHDPLTYLPLGYAFAEVATRAAADPARVTADAQASMAVHVAAMVGFQDAGAEVFDYGNSIRDEARKGGFADAFAFPGFVPAYIRPLFEEGKGPFRWAALSGDPADIAATDAAILELFPDDEHLRRWITMAGERVHYQGLPARICWLGYGERARAGLRFNEMVARGEIGRWPSGATTSTRVGRQPLPGDRGHGRRFGRRPTAAAERPAEHGVRGELGASTTAVAWASGAPSTRARCASPTDRTWRRRSWSASHQRPGNRRHAPRGRRLRPRP